MTAVPVGLHFINHIVFNMARIEKVATVTPNKNQTYVKNFKRALHQSSSRRAGQSLTAVTQCAQSVHAPFTLGVFTHHNSSVAR